MKLFQLSQPVEGATVLVLKHLDEEGTEPRQQSRYWVRFLCCGAEGEITHSGIRSRRSKKSQHCKACYDHSAKLKKANEDKKKRQPLPDFGVPQVPWDVPSSVLRTR